MSAADLITKLLEIETAIGRAGAAEMHNLVLEAQGCVLEIQRQMIDTLRENARLRERMERCEAAGSGRLWEPPLRSHAEIARGIGRRIPAPEEHPMPLPQWLTVS